MAESTPQALIIDIDGTLVDSNYLHVLAWSWAFREHDIEAESWQVHRYIGKGGDQMVTSVADQETEENKGDAIRESQGKFYEDLIGEVRPFSGARQFLEDVVSRDFGVVLASSAKKQEVDHYIDLLDAAELISGRTDSADVETTKPDPDLVEAAIDKAGTRNALMIGDSIWDVEAAKRAGLECFAVLTGGFSKAELRAAGAVEIQPSLADLLDFLPARTS